MTEKQKEEFWAVFHNLWTRDVGTDGYNKDKWLFLEKRISQLMSVDEKALTEPQPDPIMDGLHHDIGLWRNKYLRPHNVSDIEELLYLAKYLTARVEAKILLEKCKTWKEE